MTPMLYVRKTVLDLTQAEMAALAGTSQGTVSKWETGEAEPDRDQLARIRAEIHQRGLVWNDRYFFEVPAPSLTPSPGEGHPEPAKATP